MSLSELQGFFMDELLFRWKELTPLQQNAVLQMAATFQRQYDNHKEKVQALHGVSDMEVLDPDSSHYIPPPTMEMMESVWVKTDRVNIAMVFDDESLVESVSTGLSYLAMYCPLASAMDILILGRFMR